MSGSTTPPAAQLPTGTVTFVFTDIEGSTALLTKLGPDYPAVLSRHNSLIRAAIASNAGTEVKTDGDAFFIAFPMAADALSFAAAAQRALTAADWPDGVTVRVRMGIHSGEGRLSEGDYVGMDVHRAARIAAAGHGGQVIVSEATRGLIGIALVGALSLRAVGEHSLKDLPAPESLFQLEVPGLPTDYPPLRTLDSRRGNLPVQLTSFVGREDNLAELLAVMARSRLVTLTGPGGTGKTRLSIEAAQLVADSYPGGAWFIPLETIRDADLVVPEICSALGVGEDPAMSRETAFADHLASRELLLVLDNLEQVVAAGPQIARLVAAAPKCRVLASSREPLRVAGEQEFPVDALSEEGGVKLFVERARLVHPAFDPSPADTDAIREISRRLDGLPLAIELAAARVRVMTTQQIGDRLGERLRLLVGGARDLTDRQRTLRGAIEWSYELLSAQERRFFDRLAVFAGFPDIDAIEHVLDPASELDEDALSHVERLVERSLLRARQSSGETRFGFLETVREFARERLSGAADAPGLAGRHAQYFMELVERIEPELLGAEPQRFADRLEADHDEIRAAVAWSLTAGGDPRIGLRLCAAIWRFWQQRAHLREGRRLLTGLLADSRTASLTRERARALTALGGVTYWQNDMAATRTSYEKALALNRQLDDTGAIAGSLYDLSFVFAVMGEAERAAEALRESLHRYEDLGDERNVTLVREAMAVGQIRAGDYAGARQTEEAVVATYRERGHAFKIADGLSLLTLIALFQGDGAGARTFLAEATNLARRIGDRSAWASMLQLGASLAIVEGDPERATLLLGASAQLEETIGPSLKPATVLGLRDPELDIREQLPPEVLDDLLARGRAANVEQLLDSLGRM